MPWTTLVRHTWWFVQYKLSVLDVERVARDVVRDYCGQEVGALEREVQEWFHREIEATITVQGRRAIEAHRAAGHLPVLLTSGPRFSTRPLQSQLNVDHLLCSELETRAGVLTGRYLPPPCYGAGKVTRAEDFAATHDISLESSYFYTDSYTDLPMLERVGQPRAINPDLRLSRHARTHGWKIEQWDTVSDAAVGKPGQT